MLARFATVAMVFLLAACAAGNAEFVSPDPTGEYPRAPDSLLSWKPVETAKTSLALKSRTISEAALAYGAQAGMRYAAIYLNKSIESQSDTLELIFDFRVALLPDRILPPVLAQAEDVYSGSADGQSQRIVAKSLKVLRHAKFVNAAPSWRDYLVLDPTKIEAPPAAAAPESAEERAVWERNVQAGWRAGIDAARDTLRQRIAELRRDYMGMLLYKSLLLHGMVRPPRVVTERVPVAGGGPGKDYMEVGTVKKVISEKVYFVHDMAAWRALSLPVLPPEGDLSKVFDKYGSRRDGY